MALPAVDPGTPKGRVTRALHAFGASPAGRWFGIQVATRVDPWLARRTGGRVFVPVTLPVAMLTTRGRRSGQPRQTPVLYFTQGDDVVLVASSFGRERHPAWYLNITADPEISLRARGREERFVARETEGAERERLFALAERLFRGFTAYERRTDGVRRIPVLRCSPAGGVAAGERA